MGGCDVTIIIYVGTCTTKVSHLISKCLPFLLIKVMFDDPLPPKRPVYSCILVSRTKHSLLGTYF